MSAAPLDPPRYALLRQGEAWPEVELDGLEVLPDGSLELARVPALDEPWISAPGPVAPSGLALDDACGLYVADGRDGRLLRLALDCGERLVLSDPVTLGAPAGLCIGPHGWIVAADPVGRRLLVLTAGLVLREVWTAGLAHPFAVASDGRDWVAIADEGRIRRVDAAGMREAAFETAVSGVTDAHALAAGPDGTLYVATEGRVLRRDVHGAPAGPVLAEGIRAGALATRGGVLAVADRASGEVLRFALPSGHALGAVAGFAGAVAALAVGRDGRVFIKPDDGDRVLVAEPRRGRLASGRLTAGPLDAGIGAAWERAGARADVPAGTRLELFTAVSEDPAADPAWVRTAAADAELAGGRHLWLRVELTRDGDGLATPSLRQVHARTRAPGYLERLPAVYSRDPETAEPLRRLLALAQSVLDDAEADIELFSRLADAETAPAAALEALAGWLGTALPARLTAADRWPEVRALIGELPDLAERRGTPAGVARSVEIETGVRPRLFEGFRDRRTWVLGATSSLGFDTALPPADVEGLMVGRGVLGGSGPESAGAWGSALFAGSAHLVTAVIPAAAARAERAVRTALAAEAPAHLVHHVCVLRPRLAVGVQARLGLDAVVGGPPDGIALGERGHLDVDGRTAADPANAPATAGRRARLGLDTTIA